MKRIVIFASISVLLLLLASYLDAEERRQLKEEEMYNCFYAILCTERNPWVFRKLAHVAGPGLHASALRWLKEICDLDAEDTTEFWASYPDLKCVQPEEEKRSSFQEFIKRCGEYWDDVCVDQDSEECVRAGEAALQFEELMVEYTANGVCTAELVHAGKVGAEKTEEMAEEGMSKLENMDKGFPAKLGK